MRLKFIASTLLSLAVANAKLIMIIRHGEKLNDKVTNLSEKGQARADCLIEAFGQNGVYATPQKIFAQSPSEKKQSTRPRDTVIPLANSLGLQVDLSYTSNKVKKLANDIENSSEEVILISWSSDKIKDIAEKFGIKKAPKYDNDAFDDIYIITDNTIPFVKKTGVNITPNETRFGKDGMNLYIVKENVDECINRVISSINNKSYNSASINTNNVSNNNNNNYNSNNNYNTNANTSNYNGQAIPNNNSNYNYGNTNNNSQVVGNGQATGYDQNTSNYYNQGTQGTDQNIYDESSLTNSPQSNNTGNNDYVITSDSYILKTSIIAIAGLVVAALCIIY
ncbi:hypothetical protein BCR36DRAFT_586399 [Piromyces finnis]|uniref:Phosphoglycerate mutase-like protein n=1 Tax=Piromyces finnis TaxID=1754191 RepID=A0A1Y1UZA5_9FUNG|nr:hypothetical protein BCR36DRAFT_586399 [Piromyces finnis]|eukprot:ORX43934.1 hypothetical protein BCR36DRAFT_586399 [Piromyces finnis]